jgi:hypothetical protein
MAREATFPFDDLVCAHSIALPQVTPQREAAFATILTAEVDERVKGGT